MWSTSLFQNIRNSTRPKPKIIIIKNLSNWPFQVLETKADKAMQRRVHNRCVFEHDSEHFHCISNRAYHKNLIGADEWTSCRSHFVNTEQSQGANVAMSTDCHFSFSQIEHHLSSCTQYVLLKNVFHRYAIMSTNKNNLLRSNILLAHLVIWLIAPLLCPFLSWTRRFFLVCQIKTRFCLILFFWCTLSNSYQYGYFR